MPDANIKLHLGCGELHLDGYLNIDFPPSSHTVQTKLAADEFHDILDLSYPSNSIKEIRLHHVFEHFSRPITCALIASWWSWLEPGGLLHIEVPDFDRTALVVLNPFSSDHARHVALRHIFGSQEAKWAVHQEGWSPKRLKRLLQEMGFDQIQTRRNSYQGTFNFEILAMKSRIDISKNDFEKSVQSFLVGYCLNHSGTEKRILEVWMEIYRQQIEVSWAAS
jgi:predicted SAM-dependent methyltransferase